MRYSLRYGIKDSFDSETIWVKHRRINAGNLNQSLFFKCGYYQPRYLGDARVWLFIYEDLRYLSSRRIRRPPVTVSNMSLSHIACAQAYDEGLWLPEFIHAFPTIVRNIKY